jgi:hypothetical protein
MEFALIVPISNVFKNMMFFLPFLSHRFGYCSTLIVNDVKYPLQKKNLHDLLSGLDLFFSSQTEVNVCGSSCTPGNEATIFAVLFSHRSPRANFLLSILKEDLSKGAKALNNIYYFTIALS